MNRRGFLKSIGKVAAGLMVAPSVLQAKNPLGKISGLDGKILGKVKIDELMETYEKERKEFIKVFLNETPEIEHHKIIANKCKLGEFVPVVVKTAIRKQNIENGRNVFCVLCGAYVYEHLIYSNECTTLEWGGHFFIGAQVVRSLNLPKNEFILSGFLNK